MPCQLPVSDYGFARVCETGQSRGYKYDKKDFKEKCAMASFLCSWVTPGSIALAIKMATGNIVLDAE